MRAYPSTSVLKYTAGVICVKICWKSFGCNLHTWESATAADCFIDSRNVGVCCDAGIVRMS
jgi:hypothetical protein